MRRLVHLSDLHFGRARPELLEPLLAAVAKAQADLVVISGDLTQRARTAEFRQARAFLDRLPGRWLAVPGNHDVPLYNIGERLMRPFRKYRKWIGASLEPSFVDDEIAVVGCNTVDPRSHQRGKVRGSDLKRACRIFGAGPANRLNVLVGHHPFEQEASVRKALMRRAEQGLAHLSGCGMHMVLSGHLHRWRAGPFLEGLRGDGPVQVHSGTSLSSRLRGEVNDFAVIDAGVDLVEVRRMVVEESLRFTQSEVLAFRRRTHGLSLVTGRTG